MSKVSTVPAGKSRKRMLASVAAIALVASGAAGSALLSNATPARAGAVVTSDLQAQAVPSFSTVVERVKPAVVSVRVKIESAADTGSDMSGQMNNLPPQLRELFKRFGEDGGTPQQKPKFGMAQGSGFFITGDGYVVTNNHVVEHAKTVTVTMDDGKTLDARVIGTDPKTDLALLKVNEAGDYPFVALAKEAPKVGDWVVAIGNPFGLGGTVTSGIVSARGRDIGAGPYDDFLQIDAPINKGNSGGPTFNLKGEVVGVNTAIFSPSGGSVGLAFAIPAGTVTSVVDSLEHTGAVERRYLGVQIQPVTQDIADSLDLKSTAGALVAEAQPGTPAAEAGVRSGDVITKLNGQPVKDGRDLTRRVGALKPGDKAEIALIRGGKEETLPITLAVQKGESANPTADTSEAPAILGVKLAPIQELKGAGDQGVAIVNVDPDGPAASKGVSSGDVILEVAGKAVNAPAEVKAGIASAQHEGKKAVLLRLKTAEGQRFVAFSLAKA
ncbi:Do family serine endopeptidase [Bosea psychrotolerans]|uniref:Probable periplasmic serine endoprotease DegP-like n=1 Tax=Bosea psychrotolerans TaxID=1871628 RepID=A0A2S4M0P1_9HYPH|nr:Do family serine endopeptidase [Bosea psychrotolerans]POR48296.1 serine protease Do [Bosea psychrotolerans]